MCCELQKETKHEIFLKKKTKVGIRLSFSKKLTFANLESNSNNSNNGSTKMLVILLALLILNSTVVLENNFKSNSNCDWQKTYIYTRK